MILGAGVVANGPEAHVLMTTQSIRTGSGSDRVMDSLVLVLGLVSVFKRA